jgi:hypothetical protein
MHPVSNKQHRQLTIAQSLPISMGWPDAIDQLSYPHLHKPMKNNRNIIYPLNFAGAHGVVHLDEKCYTIANFTGFFYQVKSVYFLIEGRH